MKYCREQGCTTLISSGGYCEQHKRRQRKRTSWQSKNKSFYNSQAWKDLRDYVYERDGGCCNRCGKFIHGRKAHVHHVVPVRVNPKLKLDQLNVILLCNVCHPIVEDETNEQYGLKNKPKFNWKV